MKQHGRKSAASETVIAIGIATRPRAPDYLQPSEKTLWNEIVADRPPEFFDAASIPLLAEYCRLKTQLDQLAIPIGAFDPEWLKTDEGLKRYTELVRMQDRAQHRQMSLATKMRLAQQSRYVADSARARPKSGAGPKPWENS